MAFAEGAPAWCQDRLRGIRGGGPIGRRKRSHRNWAAIQIASAPAPRLSRSLRFPNCQRSCCICPATARDDVPRLKAVSGGRRHRYRLPRLHPSWSRSRPRGAAALGQVSGSPASAASRPRRRLRHSPVPLRGPGCIGASPSSTDCGSASLAPRLSAIVAGRVLSAMPRFATPQPTGGGSRKRPAAARRMLLGVRCN